MIKTIKNHKTTTFLMEYTERNVEVKMSLDSLKKGVSKISTKILKYLKDLNIFDTEF